MKKINVPFEVKDLGTKFLTSDIWFVCSDLKYKKCLRPKRYNNIDQGDKLKIVESEVREYFPYHEKNTSFVRASLFNATNSHRPDQILERKEYTYYFKLLPHEIEKCLFSLTLNGETVFSKGIQGFVSTYKVWYEDESKEDLQFIDRPINDIEVFILSKFYSSDFYSTACLFVNKWLNLVVDVFCKSLCSCCRNNTYLCYTSFIHL